MLKILQHTFIALAFVIGCTSNVYSNGIDYCKDSGDPIMVEQQDTRYSMGLTGNVNELTFCNLVIGETYLISGINELNPNCALAFGNTNNSKFLVNPPSNGNDLEIAAAPKTRFKFVAESNCLDLLVYANDCVNTLSYPVIVSVETFSTDTQSGVGEAEDDFMAPININPNMSAEDLITNIFIGGDCFDVSNVQAIGADQGLGLFSGGTASVNMDRGIIFSTGQVANAPGPCGPNASSFNGGGGDADLAQLAGINTNDATGIEFDFIPTIDQLTFNYVFGSEEYCEFVGAYNDAFGFFISGPGINGPFSNNAENIAIVPNSGGTNVAINTVNHNTNTQYFNPNANGSCGGETNCADIRYDGYTTVFQAIIENLVPCETYHIKLVVADANDTAYDTAVFLEANSFDAGGEFAIESQVPGTGGNTAVEGCQDGLFAFTRLGFDLDDPITIDFSVGGTATAGDDYVPFPTSVTIPAGESFALITVDILSDLLAEGVETITIELPQDACSCLGQTAEILIEDYIQLEVEDIETTVCGVVNSTLAPPVTNGAPLYTYLWSYNNQTTESINVSPSVTTTYTVTVTDDCGVTAEGMATVNVLPAPTAAISGGASLCAGDPNPTATLLINFTGPGPWELVYTFNGVPQPPITGITDNPFELIVTEIGTYGLASVENEFCPGAASGTAEIEEVDVELAIVPIDVLCNGETSGQIDLTVLSGDPNYTYTWNNAPPVEDPTGLGAGSYSVTVTDNNGCTEEISTDIVEPDLLTADAQLDEPVDCFGAFNGSIDLTVEGGTPQYVYNWNLANPVEDPNNLGAGTYMVTVTDLVGCTAVADIVLDEPEAILTDIVLMQDVSCNGGADGTVDLTVSGGVPQYFYDWGGGITNQSPNNLSFGNYTVTVTDQNGCSTLNSIFINEPLPIITVLTETQSVDCNNPEGAVDLVVAGGTPGYIYNWSNGSSEQSPQNVEPGPITVTVTDANQCTETATVVITENTIQPVAVAEPTGQLSCNASSVTIDGSGSSGDGVLAFAWYDENNNPLGSGNSIDVTMAGDYILIVTDLFNGCSAEVIATVEQDNDIPVADVQISDMLSCVTTTVTLDGSGSTGIGVLSYEWQDGNNVFISDQIEIDVTNSGDYILIVTSGNGCSTQAVVTVSENTAAPTAVATTSSELTCIQNSSTLDAGGSSGNGNITYEWFDSGNGPLGGSQTIDVSIAGQYTLVVTDVDNGCTDEVAVTVTENTIAPDASAIAQDQLTCTAVDIMVEGNGSTGNGTLEYDWQFGGSQYSIDEDISVSEPGIYTLIVTDADNGCTDEMSVEVFQDIQAPDAVAETSDLITCTSSTATLNGGGSSGNGNIEYNWLDPALTPIGNGVTVDVTEAGIYTLIVTEVANGCTSEATVEVEEDSNFPNADAFADGILTCENGTVLIDGSNSTSNGTLSFSWLDSGNTEVGTEMTLDVTLPDTYTLIITDEDNGCTDQTSIDVTQDIAAPSSDAGLGATLTCGANTVTLDGSNSSNGNNISYLWQNSGGVPVGTTPVVNVDETGIYTLIVTNDDNGCTDSSTAEVVPDAALPTAIAGPGATLTCVVLDVTLDGSASSNGANISYEWFDPNNGSLGGNININVSTIGTYTLVVTDNDNGCSASSSVEVSENLTAPTADAGQDVFVTCMEPTSTLDASGSIGDNLSYEWIDPNNLPLGGATTIDVTETGTYILIVTDGVNGCTEQTTVEVIPDIAAPTADPGNDGLLTCAITETTLDGNNSTGGTLEFEWLFNNAPIGATPTVDVQTVGTYTLIVTDTDNGCTDEATVDVIEDTTDPTADAGDNSLLTCVISDATLDGSNSSGGSNLEYEWLNSSQAVVGDVAVITVDETDTYTLIITNTDNGCTSSDIVEVNPDYDAPEADAGQDELLTCTEVEVTLDGSGSTGSNNLSYEWFNPTNTSISTTVDVIVGTAGTYTLVVTNDDNGCTEASSVEVEEDVDLPIVDAGQNASISCVITDATLDGSGSESGSNISYTWEDASNVVVGNTAIVTVTEVGVYTLIVTNDDTGCSASAQATIISDIDLPAIDAGVGSTLTCIETEATLDGSASETGTNITYEWLDPALQTISTTPIATADAPGTYTFIVYNGDNGCESQQEVIIAEDTTPPTAFINTGASTSLDCNTTSTVLDGTGSTPANNLTFLWNTDDGFIESGATTPNPEVNAEGTYTLIVTNTLNGCTASEDIFIDQNTTPPTAVIENPDELTCTVEEVVLDGTGSSVNGNYSYSWSNPNGGVIANGTTLQPTVDLPGVYTLQVLDEDNGCETTVSITVNEDVDYPDAVATADEEFDCVNESVTLSGNGSSFGPQFSYDWSGNSSIDDENTLSPTVYVPGTYTLLVTNNDNGCTQETTVFIDENTDVPTAAEVVAADAPCYGYPGNLSIVDVTGGQAPYVYSIDGGQSFTSVNIFPSLQPGDYNVIIQDAIGCEHEENVTIQPALEIVITMPREVPDLELGADYQIQGFVNIPDNQIDTIVWSPTFGLTDYENNLSPSVDTLLNEMEYTVTVIDTSGCLTSNKIMLRLDKTREIYIPNAFSPHNNDGQNDKFMIFANENKVKNIKTFQIFDRWGEQVHLAENFQPNDPIYGWDGLLDGKKLNPAVFVYFAEIEFIDGVTIMYKGDVTLMQ